MHSMSRRYWHNISKLNAARTGLRFASSSFVRVRVPPAIAPREAPTPLVFVSSETWDEESTSGMGFLAQMLSNAKGFTCIENDLTIPDTSKNDSNLMMKHFESELVSTVRLSDIPFPPVIFARASACLIAQTYISSNPASGMVLISPPISNKDLDMAKLPTPLEEFNYEPNFPIAVIATPLRAELLRKSNRICQSENVDIIVVESLNRSDLRLYAEIVKWFDKLGI